MNKMAWISLILLMSNYAGIAKGNAEQNENGVSLQDIDRLGLSAEIRFHGEDGKRLENLLNGTIYVDGPTRAEYVRLMEEITFVCIDMEFEFEDIETDFCKLIITGGDEQRYINDISFDNRSFDLKIRETSEYEEDIHHFLNFFNIDSATDFEFISSDSKFELAFDATAKEMQISFKE